MLVLELLLLLSLDSGVADVGQPRNTGLACSSGTPLSVHQLNDQVVV